MWSSSSSFISQVGGALQGGQGRRVFLLRTIFTGVVTIGAAAVVVVVGGGGVVVGVVVVVVVDFRSPSMLWPCCIFQSRGKIDSGMTAPLVRKKDGSLEHLRIRRLIQSTNVDKTCTNVIDLHESDRKPKQEWLQLRFGVEGGILLRNPSSKRPSIFHVYMFSSCRNVDGLG